MRPPRVLLLGALVLIGLVAVGGSALLVRNALLAGSHQAAGPAFRASSCTQAAQQPLAVPSLKGLNYGGPSTVDGDFVGTEWLRSGTGTNDHWTETQPALEADLTFIQQHDLGRTMRVFLGLDQAMRWDPDQGFVGFYEPTLQSFQQSLDMFQAHGMKVIVVLYDQEVVRSKGNFHFEALDGHHQAMRNNYLRATDTFLRRFGSNPTVIGWDLFNEAYNSLGREGGLHDPPNEDPVSPNYSNTTVHTWIHDLYQVAKCAAPQANFTVSDTTELYWRQHPDLSKYQDSVDFYDVHVYDDHPKMPSWKSVLNKPVVVGEMGAFVENQHYRDQRVNPEVVRFWLEHAASVGLTAVLAHSADDNIYPSDRSTLTPSGRVISEFSG
jgi:hypothetical protein